MSDNTQDIKVGQAQAIGRRPVLEDQVGAWQGATRSGLNLTLAIVADGIGGEQAGERAALLAVETITQVCQNATENDEREIPSILRRAIEEANAAVLAEMERYRHKQDMGCTATVAAIANSRLYLANVGDSRAYLVRGQRVTQLTVDHTWGNEMLRAGKRTADELRTNPNRDKITRSLGYGKTVKVDLGIYETPDLPEAAAQGNQGLALQAGDRIVVCSDGLIKPRREAPGHFVEPAEMATIVNSLDPNAAAVRLVELADRERHADDNVSAIVLALPGGSRTARQLAVGQRALRSPVTLAAFGGVSVAMILVCLGAIAWQVFRPSQSVPVTPTIPIIEPNYAYVSELTGIAESQPPGTSETQSLQVGSKIGVGAGSLVRVKGSGRLRLGLAEGAIVFLDSDTEVELRQVGDPVASTGTTTIQINYGQLLVSVTLRPGFAFEIVTETGAQARVTGSLMCSRYDRDAQRFDVDCLGGSCQLRGGNGSLRDLVAGEHSWLFGVDGPQGVDWARYELCHHLGDEGLVPTVTATATNPPPTETPTPMTPTPTRVFVPPTVAPPTFTPDFGGTERAAQATQQCVQLQSIGTPCP